MKMVRKTPTTPLTTPNINTQKRSSLSHSSTYTTHSGRSSPWRGVTCIHPSSNTWKAKDQTHYAPLSILIPEANFLRWISLRHLNSTWKPKTSFNSYFIGNKETIKSNHLHYRIPCARCIQAIHPLLGTQCQPIPLHQLLVLTLFLLITQLSGL